MAWSREQKEAARAQIARMAASPAFSSAGRMTALLAYLAEAELEGNSDKLNQSRIAIDVLGRDGKFDPSSDSIVRVEMGRLRTKLLEFYSAEGKDDAVIIDLPKGRYKLSIEQRSKAAPATAPASAIKQNVQFCRAKDGVNLAYAVSGDGPPLMKTSNWLTHLEYDAESPVWRHWWAGLGERFRLVRYDPRGCGLSDWNVEDISFDKWVSDFECIVEAAAPEKFAVLGTSQGASIAIAYAVRHPERISHLILYGGYARGNLKRNDGNLAEQFNVLQEIIRVGWGKPFGAFRQVFGSMFMPEGGIEQFKWFDELARVSMSAENAMRTRTVSASIDVSDLLPQIQVPTIILHAREEILVPFQEARRMAARIPGARLVSLESKNHLILENEPAWPRFLDEVEAFVKTG